MQPLLKKGRIRSEKEFRESLDVAFKNVDVDRSGFLSRIEFEDVMRRLTFCMGAEDPTPEDIDYLIVRLDQNGDGTVSKDEFQRLINIVVKIAFSDPAAKPKKGKV